MKTAVVVGNPNPTSRTLDAAHRVTERIAGAPADTVVDVVTLGPGLLGWGDDGVASGTASRGVGPRLNRGDRNPGDEIGSMLDCPSCLPNASPTRSSSPTGCPMSAGAW